MAGTIANTFFSESQRLNTKRRSIGLGVVLFVMTIIVNMAARLVVTRAERRIAGAA